MGKGSMWSEKARKRLSVGPQVRKCKLWPPIYYSDAHGCDSPCDKTKEITVELFQYRRKYIFLKEKLRIFSMKIPLQDDELYTTYTSV